MIYFEVVGGGGGRVVEMLLSNIADLCKWPSNYFQTWPENCLLCV